MNIYSKLNYLFLLFLPITVFAMDNQQATINLFKAIQAGCSLQQAQKMIENSNVDLNLSIPFTLTLRSHHVPHTFLDCVYGLKRTDIAKYLFDTKKVNPFLAISTTKSPGVSMLLGNDRNFQPLITDYISKNIDRETGAILLKDLLDYGSSSAISTVLENIKDPKLKFNIVNSLDNNNNPLLFSAVKKYIKYKDQAKPDMQEKLKKIIENLMNSGAQINKTNKEGQSSFDLVNDHALELLPLLNQSTSMPDATAQ